MRLSKYVAIGQNFARFIQASNLSQVLELMREVKEEEEEEASEDSSDISGYHSDTDSTVMMSGNSPFISKTARYNFLSRSGQLLFHVSF